MKPPWEMKNVKVFEVCVCSIGNPEEECFTDDKLYWFAEPEERPPFGLATCCVHSKYNKPVNAEIAHSWFKQGLYIPSKMEFQNR